MSLPAGGTRLTVAITGAHGLVGSALTAALGGAGHRVVRIGRTIHEAGDVSWDPSRGRLDASTLEGVDVAVHLAGENIGARRWSPEQKRRILYSRVDGTRLLARCLASMSAPPRLLISASAVGWYGSREEEVDEDAPAGTGFLADVCRQWEAAADPAREAGIRVVHPRFGVVLSRRGGALGQMALPFRLGLGGVVGSGRQSMSWVHVDDAVGALLHAIGSPELAGPVNVVSPQPMNATLFARTLARVLRRPALFPLPSVAVRLLLGEMGEELLLQGAPVRPSRLLAFGYSFLHADLEEALRAELQAR